MSRITDLASTTPTACSDLLSAGTRPPLHGPAMP
jgi:hypothetical protein